MQGRCVAHIGTYITRHVASYTRLKGSRYALPREHWSQPGRPRSGPKRLPRRPERCPKRWCRKRGDGRGTRKRRLDCPERKDGPGIKRSRKMTAQNRNPSVRPGQENAVRLVVLLVARPWCWARDPIAGDATWGRGKRRPKRVPSLAGFACAALPELFAAAPGPRPCGGHVWLCHPRPLSAGVAQRRRLSLLRQPGEFWEIARAAVGLALKERWQLSWWVGGSSNRDGFCGPARSYFRSTAGGQMLVV